MARATNAVASKRRKKKILKQAKGYFGFKKVGFTTAKQQVEKSHQYAFRDRKQVKREFRKLWIARINAAARNNGTTYSKLMAGLKKNNIEINRKMLSEMAINNPDHFKKIVEEAMK